MTDYPEQYWHCAIRLMGNKRTSVVNDLTFAELQRQIVQPWLQSRPFTISGTIVRQISQVVEIRIAYTPRPQQVYADKHDAEMRTSGITDLVTNRNMLPITQGTDYTFELLFERKQEPIPNADEIPGQKKTITSQD